MRVCGVAGPWLALLIGLPAYFHLAQYLMPASILGP